MKDKLQTTDVYGIPDCISIISASQCARIKIEDIEIIEQEGRKLHIITADKDYSYYGKMEGIAGYLIERSFFRPMKGLIINLEHIKDTSGYYVNFYSGQSVSMGKNSMSKTKKAFKRYLLRYPPYTNCTGDFRVAEGMTYDENEDSDPYEE